MIEKVPNVKGHIQVPEKLGGFKVTEIAGFALAKIFVSLFRYRIQ